MLEGSHGREQSTTTVLVQLLAQALKDPALGRHIVPIVADEARTFGMQALFRQWVPGQYATLGTDGFGRSDTRAALRKIFRVDAQSVLQTALDTLARAR